MSEIFVSFPTVLFGIQIESFSGINLTNTAAFKQSTEIKLKKLLTIIIKAGNSSTTKHIK